MGLEMLGHVLFFDCLGACGSILLVYGRITLYSREALHFPLFFFFAREQRVVSSSQPFKMQYRCRFSSTPKHPFLCHPPFQPPFKHLLRYACIRVCVYRNIGHTASLHLQQLFFFSCPLFFFFLIPYKRLWVRDKYVSSPIYPLLSLVNCYNYFFLPCATFFAQVRRLVICNDMEAVGGYWETDEGCCGSRVKI